jgi:hypothetical protein
VTTAREGERHFKRDEDLVVTELEIEHEMAGRMLREATADDRH